MIGLVLAVIICGITMMATGRSIAVRRLGIGILVGGVFVGAGFYVILRTESNRVLDAVSRAQEQTYG